MPSLHSLFHRSHSSSSSFSPRSSLQHLHSTSTPDQNEATHLSASSDMRKSRPSSPLPPPVQLPKASTAPPTPTTASAKAPSTGDKENSSSREGQGPRPKHKRIFSLTRQVPEIPITPHATAVDKESTTKNGRQKDTDTPAPPGMVPTSTLTTTTKSPPPSAAPNASPSHAPTLALLNGEGTSSHKHSSSLPSGSILSTPPSVLAPSTSAPSPAQVLTKTPSPEQHSQPPSARSSTIVVSPSLPSNLANLSVAEDVSRRSSFRHMFRRTSKEHEKKEKDKRTPKKHHTWGHIHHAKCPEKCADGHSSREAFSDAEDMSPTSLDSSIDYESAFKAVMLENIKLREENAELRRRASLPVSTLSGARSTNHRPNGPFDVTSAHGTMVDLETAPSTPGMGLENSVRELTNAIRAVPGRILIIVLIAGFVSIIRSWKFDSCVYVV